MEHTHASLADRVGTAFRVRGSEAYWTIVTVSEPVRSTSFESFSVDFESSIDLSPSQGMVTLDHPDHGELVVFAVANSTRTASCDFNVALAAGSSS